MEKAGVVTINELLEACKEQVDKGNGDKCIAISNDDEGNGFHMLFYLFTDDAEFVDSALEYESQFTADNCVVLG